MRPLPSTSISLMPRSRFLLILGPLLVGGGMLGGWTSKDQAEAVQGRRALASEVEAALLWAEKDTGFLPTSTRPGLHLYVDSSQGV